VLRTCCCLQRRYRQGWWVRPGQRSCVGGGVLECCVGCSKRVSEVRCTQDSVLGLPCCLRSALSCLPCKQCCCQVLLAADELDDAIAARSGLPVPMAQALFLLIYSCMGASLQSHPTAAGPLTQDLCTQLCDAAPPSDLATAVILCGFILLVAKRFNYAQSLAGTKVHEQRLATPLPACQCWLSLVVPVCCRLLGNSTPDCSHYVLAGSCTP
jgi:hypothetical protein